MWDEIVVNLRDFKSAVLNGVDAAGYPFSARCVPQPDAVSQSLRVELPPDAPVVPGPASVLCHKHDQQLWNQRSFLVRGTLARDATGWIFQPRQFIPGVGADGARGLLQFVIGARRTAKRYLATRNLARPRVPWQEINAIKEQAKRTLKNERRA